MAPRYQRLFYRLCPVSLSVLWVFLIFLFVFFHHLWVLIRPLLFLLVVYLHPCLPSYFPFLVFLSWRPLWVLLCLKLRGKKYMKISHTIDRSINQSVNHSLNQSINQSIHQSINQSIHQSINQSFNQSINQSFNQSINHSTNQSIIHPINQSINQPINQSINQSTDQSITYSILTQSLHRSIDQSIDQSINQSFSSPEPTILLACGRNRELWEQPFQACAIDEG